MLAPSADTRTNQLIIRCLVTTDKEVTSSSGYRHLPLSAFADRLEATPMQVALAWLLHRSPNVLLIPGTPSAAHLRENLAAGQLTLSPQTLTDLVRIAAKAVAVER